MDACVPLMGPASVFLSFADWKQGAHMCAQGELRGLRSPPMPWLWIKPNKQAWFKPVACCPGAKYERWWCRGVDLLTCLHV